MPASINVNAMYSGAVLQIIWILMVSLLQSGWSEELGTVAGEPAVLSHPYQPTGPLISIAFYERIASGLDAIVFYVSSSDSTSYPNNHDPSKFELVRETNLASMVIHNTEDGDLSTYHSIIAHGSNVGKDYNFTFLVDNAVVQSFMIEGCDANQLFDVSTKPHKISTSCEELTVTSDQYDHPYDVYYGSTPDSQKNFTCQTSSCDNKIPLDSFEVGDEFEILIDLKLISDPPTNRTFQFTYIDQTTTTYAATSTPLATDASDPSIDPTTTEQVTPTNESDTDGLELWIIIIIVIACVVVVIIITVPVVLCCCRNPKDRKANGQNPQHELSQADFYPTNPRENEYIDPANGFYGGKPATGLGPGVPAVQNAHGRSPGYHSGPVAPVVSDVRNKSKSVYTAQGYENQGYDDPPPDYDQHGQSHVARVNVY